MLFENESQKEPLITNTTKILKARKLKFPKTNLILRTYFALILKKQHCGLKNNTSKLLTRTNENTSARKYSFDLSHCILSIIKIFIILSLAKVAINSALHNTHF